jgi:hypothetical protein
MDLTTAFQPWRLIGYAPPTAANACQLRSAFPPTRRCTLDGIPNREVPVVAPDVEALDAHHTGCGDYTTSQPVQTTPLIAGANSPYHQGSGW